jgi:flagellar protein FlaJ
MGKIPGRLTKRSKSKNVKVEEAKEPFAIRFVSKHGRLRNLANKTAANLRQYIPETGRTFSPYKFAAQSVFALFVSFAVVIPLALLLAVFVSPLALALLALLPLLFFMPWIRISMWAGDRKRAVSEELPFFAVHATILQSAGLDLYNALVSTIGKGVFRQIEQDAAIMKRNTTYFRMGPLEGLEELGRTTPEPKMKSLLLGYSSEWRSGGDTAHFLESKTNEFLKDTEERWKRYVDYVSIWGELIISFLFLLPILLIMAMFFSPGLGTTLGMAFISVGIPTMTSLGVALVRTTQPKNYDAISGNAPAAAVIGLISGAVTFAILNNAIFSAIVGGVAAFVSFGVAVAVQRREIKAHETALPQFLRDITEYQKMGYDLVKGTIRVADESEYNPKFDRLLKNVAHQLSLGIRFSELSIPTRSWLTRVAFFHLGEIAESGGYASKSLEMLNEFIGTVLRVKRNTQSAMKLYKGISLVAPIGLSAILGLLLGVFSSFSKMLSSAPAMPGVSMPTAIWEIPSLLVPLSQVIIVASAIGVALVSSYASDFTLKNTLWVAVCLALAGVGLVLVGLISGIVSTIIPSPVV